MYFMILFLLEGGWQVFSHTFLKKRKMTRRRTRRDGKICFLALIKELQDMGSHPNVFSYFYIFICLIDLFACLSVCLFVCLSVCLFVFLSVCYFWLWYFQSLSFAKLLSLREKEVYSKAIWPNLVPLQIFSILSNVVILFMQKCLILGNYCWVLINKKSNQLTIYCRCFIHPILLLIILTVIF